MDQVFLFGEIRDDLQVECTQGPKTVPLQIAVGKKTTDLKYPSIALLDTAFDNSRYLVLVNSAETTVNAKISGLPTTDSEGHPIQFASQNLLDKTHPTIVDGTFSTEIKPLGVQVWKFNQ